jgi:hypothetical protein
VGIEFFDATHFFIEIAVFPGAVSILVQFLPSSVEAAHHIDITYLGLIATK